jgi:predicted nucleotide-binding protein
MGDPRSVSRRDFEKAISIPLRDASRAKDDGRLPMTDQNPRIFVVCTHDAEARAIAEAIVHDAFHNVTFFDGAIIDLPELLGEEDR